MPGTARRASRCATPWCGQCARARELCDELTAREGVAELVRDTTGLVLSPYYPAGKMAWILANVPAAAEAAAAGELCLGTIDAWVVWTLTGGAEFRCDWSNASRTQLFDLRRGCWSEPVCEAFGVDVACLPQVTDSDGLFGMTDLGRLFASARAHSRRAGRQPRGLVCPGLP